MNKNRVFIGAALCVFSAAIVVAQERGQYLPGMSAANSGVMPDTGFTYANYLYIDSSDRLKNGAGKGIPVSGSYSIFADNNIFIYVYKPKILGGQLESIADITVANGNLAATVFSNAIGAGIGKPIQGGGAGLANTYFVPLQIGWHTKRADVQTGYAFFAPTGRYTAGASNNIGTGYWTNSIQAGATFYLTANKGTSINAFNIYSWNTQQQTTKISYGQNDTFDYSVTQMLPLQKDNKLLLQIGPAGYGQWQTSDPSGPGLLPSGGTASSVVNNSRFGVNGLGFVANILAPSRKVVVGVRSFWEMGAYSTKEGKVLMFSGTFGF